MLDYFFLSLGSTAQTRLHENKLRVCLASETSEWARKVIDTWCLPISVLASYSGFILSNIFPLIPLANSHSLDDDHVTIFEPIILVDERWKASICQAWITGSQRWFCSCLERDGLEAGSRKWAFLETENLYTHSLQNSSEWCVGAKKRAEVLICLFQVERDIKMSFSLKGWMSTWS